MKNERILSYKMSQALTQEELKQVSAAGVTNTYTANGSYSTVSGYDGMADASWDM
jgi:hypothetical protein